MQLHHRRICVRTASYLASKLGKFSGIQQSAATISKCTADCGHPSHQPSHRPRHRRTRGAHRSRSRTPSTPRSSNGEAIVPQSFRSSSLCWGSTCRPVQPPNYGGLSLFNWTFCERQRARFPFRHDREGGHRRHVDVARYFRNDLILRYFSHQHACMPACAGMTKIRRFCSRRSQKRLQLIQTYTRNTRNISRYRDSLGFRG